MPQADDPVLRSEPTSTETPELTALVAQKNELEAQIEELKKKGHGGGSVAITGEAKVALVEKFEAIREQQSEELRNPGGFTEQIRQETGVTGYNPVKHMSMEEARRRGLVAPVDSFEDLDEMGELDPDAIAWYKERNLPLPERKQRIKPIAPNAEIQAKWDKDVQKLSPEVSGEEIASITGGVKLEVPKPASRVAELEC